MSNLPWVKLLDHRAKKQHPATTCNILLNLHPPEER